MGNPTDYTPSLSSGTLGGISYGLCLGLSLAGVALFIIMGFLSYICNRHGITAVSGNYGRGGLDAATLSSYPQDTYSQLKFGKSAAACSVCLADYREGDLLRMMPECGHLFHRSCVDQWLVTHTTCPVCRNSLTTAQTPA